MRAIRELSERDIIRIIREEWNARLVNESIDAAVPPKEKQSSLVPTDLVVKKDGIKYTVASVGKDDVTLKTPEGVEFLISKEEFENYKVK
jgi:hypothetical protein